MPVRLGGPWERGGDSWEHWRHGSFAESGDKRYRARNGIIEYEYSDGWGASLYHESKSEFRPPKGWTGDLPEGCCLATDFVVGQRVRYRDKRYSDGRVERMKGSLVRVIGFRRGTQKPCKGISTESPETIEGY